MSKFEPGMAFNMKTLNKVFAVLAVLFLFSVIWMFLDDYIRPWKFVQIKGLEIEREVLEKQAKLIEGEIDPKELKKLTENLEKAKADLEKHNEKLAKLRRELAEADRDLYVQNMNTGSIGALKGEVQFKYENALVHGHHDKAKEYKKKLDELVIGTETEQDRVKFLSERSKGISAQIRKIELDVTEAQKSLESYTVSLDRLLMAKKKTEKSLIWFARNAPFVDFLDPTLKIHQYVVHNAMDDRYFQHVPKVDRCTTCHLFIDKKGFEEQENPYKTHPDLDTLAVGLNSHHPVKDFGCTSCHNGEGQRVFDFSAPAHMPNSKKQEDEWKKKYGWHAPHKVDSPMLPLKHTEAGCLKCHNNVQNLDLAPKLNNGRKVVQDYGCYACHKIEGWEFLGKPAPSLHKIKAKVSKEFAKNWIWSPFAFNAHSKMPSFFQQSNNKEGMFVQRNKAEVNSMVDFLWENSRDFKPTHKYVGGDIERGKELVEMVGCVACHQVEGIDEKFDEAKSLKGPYLTALGSKVDKDWLVSWLIKPSHYQSDTVMPSFRLSEKEANDISSFLLSFTNETFQSLKFEKLDNAIRDSLLVDYFMAFDSRSVAEKKLALMSDHERTMELGRRSIGKYGCYSCHDIDGFEGWAPIGPELTEEGSKPIHQFGYGQQHHVGHTRHDWLTAHLEDPRVWDIGVPKKFKDLNRMPNFYFNKNQVEDAVTFILGNVGSYVPLAGKKLLSSKEKIVEEGKRIVEKYSCDGCHKIDGKGGALSELMETEEEGAPYLVKQGEKVKSDWFYSFMKHVKPIRPFVLLRMPSFEMSDEEINKLINYFITDAGVNHFDASHGVKWEEGEREAALELWDELACTSCHVGGFSEEDPWMAPDLHFAKKRLRPEWIMKWLSDPAGILPYTTMANFWEDGTAMEGVLDDDPVRQQRALLKLILEMGSEKNAVPFKEGNTSPDMKFLFDE